jgi:hypothetical protein
MLSVACCHVGVAGRPYRCTDGLFFMQAGGFSDTLSPQQCRSVLHNRLLELELELQAKDRCIQQLKHEMSVQHSLLHPHSPVQQGIAPSHVASGTACSATCENRKFWLRSCSVHVHSWFDIWDVCTGTPCSTCGSPHVDIRALQRPAALSLGSVDSRGLPSSPAVEKQDLIEHWRTGVSRAQEMLVRLREQHEHPSSEEISDAVSKAQEAAAALHACASIHDFGFGFDCVQRGIPAQAGTVAVDALGAALRAAHLHVLQASNLNSAELLQELQQAWSAIQCTCRLLCDHTGDHQMSAQPNNSLLNLRLM